jgi:hypothetical protein
MRHTTSSNAEIATSRSVSAFVGSAVSSYTAMLAVFGGGYAVCVRAALLFSMRGLILLALSTTGLQSGADKPGRGYHDSDRASNDRRAEIGHRAGLPLGPGRWAKPTQVCPGSGTQEPSEAA